MTGFMRLRGVGAGPESVSAPGDEPGVFVELHDARPMDTGALYRALTEPGEDVTSGIEVTLSDVGGGLELWLALNEPDLVRLAAIGQAADRGLVPALIAYPGGDACPPGRTRTRRPRAWPG
jgi:hypothetical protein